MRSTRLLPIAAVLLAGGATAALAQGYDPRYDAPPPGYEQGGYDQRAYDDRQGYDDQQGYGQDVPSIDVFYRPLAQYGEWVDSRWGRAWSPRVANNWRPYTNGYWGQNRLWMSDEPWGWATYHYGRWAFDEREGWLWIPGTEWAPSWVAWRDADDYSGWAPLPPGVSVSFALGFGAGYDSWDRWYQPSWVWVPRTYVYQRGLGSHIVPWTRGRDFWERSRWQARPQWPRPSGTYRPGEAGRPGGWNGQYRQGDNNGQPYNGGQWRNGQRYNGQTYNGQRPQDGRGDPRWQNRQGGDPRTTDRQPWPRPGYEGRPGVNGTNGSVTPGAAVMPGAVQGANGSLTPPANTTTPQVWRGGSRYQGTPPVAGGAASGYPGGRPGYVAPQGGAPSGYNGGRPGGFTPPPAAVQARPVVTTPPPVQVQSRPAYQAPVYQAPPPQPRPAPANPPAPRRERGENERPQ